MKFLFMIDGTKVIFLTSKIVEFDQDIFRPQHLSAKPSARSDQTWWGLPADDSAAWKCRSTTNFVSRRCLKLTKHLCNASWTLETLFKLLRHWEGANHQVKFKLTVTTVPYHNRGGYEASYYNISLVVFTFNSVCGSQET